MRILYVTQFYPPESIAPAFRASDHARYWKEWGNEVIVFTGLPNYPSRKLYPGYTTQLFSEETIDGIKVFRSKEYIGANTSLMKRAVNTGSFLVFGLLNWQLHKKEIAKDMDIVLATTGTIFAGLLGYRMAKALKKPLVIEFRDLTYIQLQATGNQAGSWKVRLVKGLELFLARNACRVIVVTDGLRDDLIRAGIPAEKISVIPNGADLVSTEHHYEDQIKLGYFGTIGISQNVLQTIELAQSLIDQGLDLRYTIIGEGAERDLVEEWVAVNKPHWLDLEHGVSKNELEARYSDVDMTVVSLVDDVNFRQSIPSKIFQSLARGVPVLFLGPQGEASELIEENNAGLALCSTPEANLNKAHAFVAGPDYHDRLAAMSVGAVSLMRERFTRESMAKRLLRILEEAANATKEARKAERKG